MITDVRASKMFLLLHQGESVAGIARRLNMSEKTIRKYRDADKLPSQIERPERTYRTREDPLAEYWSEIEDLLERDPRLKPYAILDWLKQKYNPPQGEPCVTVSIRRTLERRVGRWKLEHGVEQEVKFPQVHHAGDVLAFDFVGLNSLQITIDRKPFTHMLFHAVFTYSNWEYVHLCHSESFEALSAGLQDAFAFRRGRPATRPQRQFVSSGQQSFQRQRVRRGVPRLADALRREGPSHQRPQAARERRRGVIARPLQRCAGPDATTAGKPRLRERRRIHDSCSPTGQSAQHRAGETVRRGSCGAGAGAARATSNLHFGLFDGEVRQRHSCEAQRLLGEQQVHRLAIGGTHSSGSSGTLVSKAMRRTDAETVRLWQGGD